MSGLTGEALLPSVVNDAALPHMAQHMLRMCVLAEECSHGNVKGKRGHVETYKAS